MLDQCKEALEKNELVNTPEKERKALERGVVIAEIFYDIFKSKLNGDRSTDHKIESYEGKMFVLTSEGNIHQVRAKLTYLGYPCYN